MSASPNIAAAVQRDAEPVPSETAEATRAPIPARPTRSHRARRCEVAATNFVHARWDEHHVEKPRPNRDVAAGYERNQEWKRRRWIRIARERAEPVKVPVVNEAREVAGRGGTRAAQHGETALSSVPRRQAGRPLCETTPRTATVRARSRSTSRNRTEENSVSAARPMQSRRSTARNAE